MFYVSVYRLVGSWVVVAVVAIQWLDRVTAAPLFWGHAVRHVFFAAVLSLSRVLSADSLLFGEKNALRAASKKKTFENPSKAHFNSLVPVALFSGGSGTYNNCFSVVLCMVYEKAGS